VQSVESHGCAGIDDLLTTMSEERERERGKSAEEGERSKEGDKRRGRRALCKGNKGVERLTNRTMSPTLNLDT
jgi:hypothetical protein